MKFFKRLFYRPVKLLCGTVNTETGETTTGYRAFDGNIFYKKNAEQVSVWGPSEYVGVVTRTLKITNLITKTMRDDERKCPMYRENHLYDTARHRYYVTIDGLKKYIHTESYDKDKEIILV